MKSFIIFLVCPDWGQPPGLDYIVTTVIEEPINFSGTVIQLSCGTDHRINDAGLSTQRCLENGKWEFPFPYCLKSLLFDHVFDIKFGIKIL